MALTLREFIEQAWPILEPVTPFIGGYHVDAICEHLEAVSCGALQNLIINIPPRHTKSTLVSVIWPMWEWTQQPAIRWLFASYGLALSIRDSLKCRRLIESAWYQAHWGGVFQLTSDQNQKMRFENNRTGYRLATSTGGAGTGEGGDRIVVDDPHNAQDADSDTKLQSALDWWDGTMSTRGNDPQRVARVIVMQRLHERDLTGHLLEQQQHGGPVYDHLVLPAEYEPRVQVCSAGLEHDSRTAPGALLSPDRFDGPALALLAASLGEYRAAGQLQQRPAPAGGAIFQRAWWAEGQNRYTPQGDEPLPERCVARYLSFDTAMKDQDQHDYTACTVFELQPDYRLRVAEVWAEKLAFPDLLRNIEATATRRNADGMLREIIIEDKGSGTSAGQTLLAGASPWLVSRLRMFVPLGSKVYRARQASLWPARGCVLLPHPAADVPWLYDFEHQLYTFPAAAHDDMVDSFTQGLIYLENVLATGWHARGGAGPEVA